MKFIECYIENFGKLSQFKLDFTEGLNVILRDNGFGKTTFAAFLQAMFYGLDSGRGKDSDRKKYEPWQGGKFGGSLIFSVNGKNYRMERFFGKKEKDDTFTLYNEETGLESKDYSENIGCEIFGINKESYGKCTYVPQGKIESELSGAGDINAKLSDLSEADNDMASFDNAMKELKDLKNKYKRSSGLIAEKEFAKSDAEAALKHSESLLETERTIKSELQVKRNFKKELFEKIEKLHKSYAEKEKAEHYKTLKKDAEEAERKIKEYESELKKIPTEAELSAIYNLSEEYKKYITLKKASELSEAEIKALSVADCDERALLTDDEYKILAEELREYRTKKAVTESALLTEEENKRLCNLRKMFSEKDFDMTKLEEIYYRAREGKEKLEFLKEKKFPLIPLISGAALLVVGIILMVMKLFAAGAVFALLGIVIAFVFAFKNVSDNKKIRSEIDFAKQAVKKADEVFSTYDSDFDGKHEEAIRTINHMHNELINLELKEKNAIIFKNDSGIEELKKILDEKSRRYLNSPFDEDSEDAFHEFYKYSEEIKILREKKTKYSECEHLSEAKYSELKAVSGAFIDAEPEKAYEELKILCEKLNIEKGNFESKSIALKEFIAANGIPEENISETETVELEAAKDVLNETEDVIKNLEKRLGQIVAETEKIPELTSEVSTLEEETDALKKKVMLIEKTEEALQSAKDNLTAKYLGPLAERFELYKTTLLAPENAKIDAELNIGTIEYGEKHQSSSYSTGLRDILALALRFSLVDALFEGEKPVVILDDPFTNLDKERIEKAKEMLETLKKEYQIIYLTCHESRV